MSVKNTTNETNKIQQENLFEPILYNVAENAKNQSSFIKSDFIKKIKINNYESFEQFLLEKIILNYNVSEEITGNYSRLFLDIDMHPNDDIKQLSKLKTFILNFTDNYNLKCYGYFDIKTQEFKEHFDKSFSKFGFITVINTHLTDKILSGHISFNGYQDRDEILKYLTHYINNILYQNDTTTKIIDDSVIKHNGKRQILRAVFSSKPLDKIDRVLQLREIPKENIKTILDNKEYIFNIRMTPLEGDTLIQFPEIKEEPKINNTNNITTTNTNINTINTTNNTNKNINKHISIFQYLKSENIAKELPTLNYYDFSHYFYQISKSILSPEEFINEVKNIEPIIGDTEHDYPKWYDKVIKRIDIKQDFKNPAPIYSLINTLNKKIKEFEKDKEHETNEDYTNIKNILKRLFKYLGKYSKLIFVAADKYDFFDVNNDNSKIRTLTDNVYSILNDSQYYYPYNNEFYTPAEFKRYFKLSGESFEKFKKYVTIYSSSQEYQRCKAAYQVSQLSQDEKNHYTQNIIKFLEILKTSFVYPDDYQYYLSYFALKLQSNKSIRKGLINQGTFKSPAINSFKTLFNEMINNYSVVKQANVNNINKELNGTYFIGDLLIIEELPKKIKNIDNLLNIFREYSNKRTITVEEKGMRPYEITNKCDYIINTNHTTEEMFKDHNDAEGLLKRFRIIVRKSITITKEISNLLDDMEANNNIYQYFLRDYLINTITPKYFIEHKDEYNLIMRKYLDTSSDKTQLDKTTIKSTKEEFIKSFMNIYMDKQKRLRLNKFREYLIKVGVLKLANAKTLKQKLMLLLSEDKEILHETKNNNETESTEEEEKTYNDKKYNKELIKITNDNKYIKIINIKAIEIIYETYFEYDENSDNILI